MVRHLFIDLVTVWVLATTPESTLPPRSEPHPPRWHQPPRPPGVVAVTQDLRGAIMTVPATGSDARTAAREFMVHDIGIVRGADGGLFVKSISGERDDGTFFQLTTDASGTTVDAIDDLKGAKVTLLADPDAGEFTIEDIDLATATDGHLYISYSRLRDRYGTVLEAATTSIDVTGCTSTLVGSCVCPNFFGFCSNANYPSCPSSPCSFGTAACQNRLSVACGAPICIDAQYRSGICVVNQASCFCAQIPEWNEMGTNELPVLIRPLVDYIGHGVYFTLQLAQASAVRIAVYDVAGRRVGRVLETHLGAGAHDMVWSFEGALASGQYFLRVEAMGRVVTTRFVVAR